MYTPILFICGIKYVCTVVLDVPVVVVGAAVGAAVGATVGAAVVPVLVVPVLVVPVPDVLVPVPDVLVPVPDVVKPLSNDSILERFKYKYTTVRNPINTHVHNMIFCFMFLLYLTQKETDLKLA
jgi:hypothetical protein